MKNILEDEYIINMLFILQLVWVLYCDLLCLDYDGNITDACVLALLAALKNGKNSVFQLDFEMFRTVASYIKISSGHSLIIKLIFMKFFSTILRNS